MLFISLLNLLDDVLWCASITECVISVGYCIDLCPEEYRIHQFEYTNIVVPCECILSAVVRKLQVAKYAAVRWLARQDRGPQPPPSNPLMGSLMDQRSASHSVITFQGFQIVLSFFFLTYFSFMLPIPWDYPQPPCTNAQALTR